MALKVGELYAALTLSKSAYKAGLAEAEAETKASSSRLGKTFGEIGQAAKVGLMAAGVGILAVGAAMVGLGVIGAKHAIEEEKAQRLVQAAYRGTAAAVDAWANKNQVAMGVTKEAIELSLSSWGMYAKNIGLNTAQAASSGEALAQRAADIAAATGTSFSDVFTALMKGTEGATRGLKAYGVAIDTNAIKQQAQRMGLYSGTGALDIAAASQAR